MIHRSPLAPASRVLDFGSRPVRCPLGASPNPQTNRARCRRAPGNRGPFDVVLGCESGGAADSAGAIRSRAWVGRSRRTVPSQGKAVRPRATPNRLRHSVPGARSRGAVSPGKQRAQQLSWPWRRTGWACTPFCSARASPCAPIRGSALGTEPEPLCRTGQAVRTRVAVSRYGRARLRGETRPGSQRPLVIRAGRHAAWLSASGQPAIRILCVTVTWSRSDTRTVRFIVHSPAIGRLTESAAQ